MSLSLFPLILLLCAAVGSLGYIRFRRHRKFLAECAQHQKDAERKMMHDRINLEEIRVRLAHEDVASTAPGVEVYYFELDEQGRGPHERFLDGLPELPPIQLHGEGLNTIECPEFHSYKIPAQQAAA